MLSPSVREDVMSASFLLSSVAFCKDRDRSPAWMHHSPALPTSLCSCPVPLLLPHQTQTFGAQPYTKDSDPHL